MNVSIPWDDIRFYVAAARARTLAGAARELGVDQSTVSRRLNALEKALGVRLFDRTPEGLLPTPAGERLVRPAATIESAVLDFERLAGAEDHALAGDVRVATNDVLAARFILPRLGRLRERLPDVNLKLLISRAWVDLTRREADLAVRMVASGMTPGEPSLVAEKLCDAALAVYGSRTLVERVGAPSSPADLARFDLLLYEVPVSPGERWIEANVGRPNVTMRCETMIAMRAAIGGGHGIGVLFAFDGDDDPSLVRLSPTFDPWGLYLVAHPDVRAIPRVRAVMDFLTEITHANRELLSGIRPGSSG